MKTIFGDYKSCEQKVNGLTFEEWTQQVDDICEAKWGADVESLIGDWDTYAQWHGENTPEDAFEYVDEEIRDCIGIAQEIMGLK